jgi:ribosomal protein S27AE
MKITLNQIRCLNCGSVIISTHRHDFVTCKCGTVSVDGGTDYLRRCFRNSPEEDYEELSENEE